MKISGDKESDYINASYIDVSVLLLTTPITTPTPQGYNKPDMYIAAQGPMPTTIDDFWRMIWEHKLTHVVVLTKCREAGKVKIIIATSLVTTPTTSCRSNVSSIGPVY